MQLITTTNALADYCTAAAQHSFVTVDTEFLREKTYYSQLCLVQMAFPGPNDSATALVDPLSDSIDLAPLYDLFLDPTITKVFHAARQDLEIFFVDRQIIPRPFFDTQVAAMVCGYGDQVGYGNLVQKILGTELDKSSRFTNWSARPLSDKQLRYALDDVTYLRDIYQNLITQLEQNQRSAWVDEEISTLVAPETYQVDPDNIWRRVKTRNNSGKFLAVVREISRFRELYAQRKNIPRARVFKDDVILELAATRPGDIGALNQSRLLHRDARSGDIAKGLLSAIKAGIDCPQEDYPQPEKRPSHKPGNDALASLLRILLKAQADAVGVAPKLIANSADLDAVAAGKTDGPIFSGWRHKIFGRDAQRLCAGEIALTALENRIKTIEL